MISYLLATKHDISYSQDTIDSILALPDHDKEIIICCPEDKISSCDKFVWVPDTLCIGSANAFNIAYAHSKGNYIATIIDDIILPSNFLDMLDFMSSDFISNKLFKVANTMWDGGPGLHTFGHPELVDGTSYWPIDKWHSVDKNKCPYSIIPLPFFERTTIEQLLSNKLFHPAFKNHFVDHWLGFFISHNEIYEPYNWRCPTIKYKISTKPKQTEVTNDQYDMNILHHLTETFVPGTTSYV